MTLEGCEKGTHYSFASIGYKRAALHRVVSTEPRLSVYIISPAAKHVFWNQPWYLRKMANGERRLFNKEFRIGYCDGKLTFENIDAPSYYDLEIYVVDGGPQPKFQLYSSLPAGPSVRVP